MNRYPLWKNLLVFGVIVLSTIVALPNVFGDDEAVQVSRTDGVAIDAPTLEQVRMTLTEAGVTFMSAEIEGISALVRLEDVQLQERARDVLAKAMPNNVVALTLSPRTPGWLKAIGLEPMLLGLDLRGGVHFLYEVDLDTAVGQFLTTYETDLRTQFRQREIRNDIRVDGTTLEIAIIEPADMDAAETIIRALDSGDQLMQLGQLTSRLVVDRAQVDGRPGFNVRLTDSAIRERQDFAIQQNTLTLRNRVNELGVAEAVVQRQGLDRILVELPGIQDPATAKRVLGSTATLEFHLVDMENDAFEAERRGRAPLGSELHHRRQDNSPILLRRDIIASGDQLVDATQQYTNGQPVVKIRLDTTAARKMLDTTIGNMGKMMAVLYIEDRPQMVERDGETCPAIRSAKRRSSTTRGSTACSRTSSRSAA